MLLLVTSKDVRVMSVGSQQRFHLLHSRVMEQCLNWNINRVMHREDDIMNLETWVSVDYKFKEV